MMYKQKWTDTNRLEKEVCRAGQYGFSRVHKTLKLYKKIFIEKLIRDKKIILTNIGTFQLIVMREIKRYSPNTKQIVNIPKHYKVKFIPSVILKKRVRSMSIDGN